MDDTQRESTASSARHSRADEVRRRFIATWEAGDRPKVEEFVDVNSADDMEVFSMLLMLEVELRRKAGEQVPLEELTGRFPGHSSIGRAALISSDPASPITVSLTPNQFQDSQAPQLLKVGRYRVTGQIGIGGFGVVLSAFDDELHRVIAIKLPHWRWSSGLDFAENYLNEARVLARLDHPGIVPVYDFGRTDDGRPYVVSKFIEGSNLQKVLARGRQGFAIGAGIVAGVADALNYAHLQRIVHRDVKPSNILVDTSGRVYLADFGIVLREEDYGTGPTFAGTPAYMSPEQARCEGHRVDGRSDIFSLGVVLYQVLSGRRPFRSDTEQELLQEVIECDPCPPRQIDESIPRELERICLKAMSKRSADRYTTARDMAEDLRSWLAIENANPALSPSSRPDSRAPDSAHTPRFADDCREPSATGATTTEVTVKRELMQIVPKGLRSFDARDADFFLELLPGPRDRDGLPNSIRFWKSQIEAADPDETFTVGLVYGPSGCGKSSLIKAGLLPRLSSDVSFLYVESTAIDTESRLLVGLHKRFPGLRDLTLVDALAAVRRGHDVGDSRKLVIVIDQFEQWLHGNTNDDDLELVRALRHCDGARLQCVVIVRDDFWLAVSRFLNQLEVRLVEGENSSLVDLFDLHHSRKVLTAFGRAYGRIPMSADAPAQCREFLSQSLDGLAEDNKIAPIRLALFAEMMKSNEWTPKSLRAMGGAAGVGVAFLEETFSSPRAPPEHRLHHLAAKAVLHMLLPESGSDIKGAMRSREELLEASGYRHRPRDFDSLMQILDAELRLITPTDPEGSSGADDGPASDTRDRYYQLTHDYLVAALRDWLTHHRRKTWRGRAELCLEERTRQWIRGQENGFLPSAAEYLKIQSAVPRSRQSPDQRALLSAARRYYGLRIGGVLAGITALLLLVFLQQRAHRVQATHDAVNDLLLAAPDAVDFRVERLRPFESIAKPMLSDVFEDPSGDAVRRLRAAYGLAAFGDVQRRFLIEAIGSGSSGECKNLVTALWPVRNEIAPELYRQAIHEQTSPTKAARLAIMLLHFGEPKAAQSLSALRPDPARRMAVIHMLPSWHAELAPVCGVLQQSADGDLNSALIAGLGMIEPEKLGAADLQLLNQTVGGKFTSAPDPGTHGASLWALKQWKAPLPTLPRSTQVVKGQEWFLNPQGMTMLRLPAGIFRMGDPADANYSRLHAVTLTKPFFVADRQVTVRMFSEFMQDISNPAVEKPDNWPGPDTKISPLPDCPVQKVSWHDAIMYCNWLSIRNGLRPCYRRSATDKTIWEWDIDANGYRLPTEAEREYACRAMSQTQFCFGDDESLLRNYAVFREPRTLPVARLQPNAWGLFDMHGNVHEWCWNLLGEFPATPETDPRGPIEGTSRVTRGGCYFQSEQHCTSGKRLRAHPDERMFHTGFRVICAEPR